MDNENKILQVLEKIDLRLDKIESYINEVKDDVKYLKISQDDWFTSWSLKI